MAMSLVGQTAPDVTLPRDGGGNISLGDLRGAPVILYFYPRDDTSGCTREALEFSEHLTEFAALGATVVGVSKDTVAKHDKFIAKHRLKVVLASDAEDSVCETYGVWVEKNMYGRKFWGVERATFLIDGAGVVQKEWRRVKVPGHVEAVLEAVRGL